MLSSIRWPCIWQHHANCVPARMQPKTVVVLSYWCRTDDTSLKLVGFDMLVSVEVAPRNLVKSNNVSQSTMLKQLWSNLVQTDVPTHQLDYSVTDTPLLACSMLKPSARVARSNILNGSSCLFHVYHGLPIFVEYKSKTLTSVRKVGIHATTWGIGSCICLSFLDPFDLNFWWRGLRKLKSGFFLDLTVLSK